MRGIKYKQILEAAEKVVALKGVEKARLTDVAKELGISHAALYKHYKNKEHLFEKLVTDWLERTEEEVLNYQVEDGENPVQAVHDWLSLLAATKRKSYESDSKMFKLYTVYIARSESILTRHLTKLRNKVEDVLGVSSPNAMMGMGLILSFEYFHNPMYCDYWKDPQLMENFEAVWELVKPKLQSTIEKQ